MKYTPAPWFVHKPNQIDRNWKIMEHDEIAGATIAVLDGKSSHETIKANANLIASAPELLEYLEEAEEKTAALIQAMQDRGIDIIFYSEILDKWRLAIEKAKAI